MKRLFTFGCSFTAYKWPTWADILSQNYNVFENWGRAGGGNHFILYRLVECIKRNQINKDDTVCIMWTSAAREDRFLKDKWDLQGTVYNSSYTEDYVKNFTDPTGYFLTSVTVIDAAKQLLDKIGCQYKFMSILPLSIVDDSYFNQLFSLTETVEKQVKHLYKDTLDIIAPSVYDIIFDKDWHSRDSIIIPSGIVHVEKLLKEKYYQFAGIDWPSYDDFFNNRLQGVTPAIITELTEQFRLIPWRDELTKIRQDQHPTPNEYLEYLDKIGGFDLSQSQIDYANHWNQKVLTLENISHKTAVPKKSFGNLR
jgi:hypothetical protein